MPQAPQTAALLLIGDEILSGKVEEANLVVLARTLRSLGIALRRVVTIGDDVDLIAREVAELSRTHDHLITSGGVGPTHDDVTVPGVAQAFGVAVELDPGLVAMLRDHYKERCTEGHLLMARVPAGATLEVSESVRWPTIRLGNTWLFPGIPEVFRLKLPVLAARLAGGRPWVSHAVYTQMDEGDLKPLLDPIVAQHPEVSVGSYPKWSDPTYRTKLTFDGQDADAVRAAVAAFVALLPAGEPQRTEP
ncbi:MAG TPA: molybdopterin-binding protein [Polyangiaceae bacterium]|nr:molybdopterin-binding protein [Polyangiaceae bacterium]